MTYTAWKRALVPGTRLFVENHRRPRRSRHVVVISANRRHIILRDVDDVFPHTRIELPAATFTSMKDNVCTILSGHDGPRFDIHGKQLAAPLLAGQPLYSIELLR